MIEEDRCSFEVAKLLKEKGFNELCNSIYIILENGDYRYSEINIPCKNSNNYKPNAIVRPTHQMVRKWLRDEKRVYIDILLVPHNDGGIGWMFSWYRPDVDDVIHSDFSEYSTYEECTDVAIKYVLENYL